MPDGGVFPCAVLTGADPFFYGNIRTQDLGEIMQNSVRTRLLDRHQQLPQTCMDCPFISFCRGGCMHQSYTRNGSPYTFANYCEKELFVHIEQQLLVNGYFSPIDRRAIIARRLDSAGFVPYNNRSFLRKIGTPKTPTIQASGEEVKS
jgi:radical SAM protein with 4Fe4S-binding SPASM domain